jgi:hypothetical protein
MKAILPSSEATSGPGNSGGFVLEKAGGEQRILFKNAGAATK